MTCLSLSGLVVVGLLISACGASAPVATTGASAPAVTHHQIPGLVPGPPAECRADTYEFVGRGSLNSLGILHPDRAEPTDPNDMQGTFWVPQGVTILYERDDRGIEEVRSFCAVLDGYGAMVNMPVAPDWETPR